MVMFVQKTAGSSFLCILVAGYLNFKRPYRKEMHWSREEEMKTWISRAEAKAIGYTMLQRQGEGDFPAEDEGVCLEKIVDQGGITRGVKRYEQFCIMSIIVIVKGKENTTKEMTDRKKPSPDNCTLLVTLLEGVQAQR